MITCIIGSGISGLTLAITLQSLNLPFVILEKDSSFASRNQGYGLTIQQGGSSLNKLLLSDLLQREGLTSYRHCVFNSKGKGIIDWSPPKDSTVKWKSGRNCHISRESLRRMLYDNFTQNGGKVHWGVNVCDIEQLDDKVQVTLSSPSSSSQEIIEADLLAGCDGIYSIVRQHVINDSLQYLGVFVILGIVTLSPPYQFLSENVIQMSDGDTRIFCMPYSKGKGMWQLSFTHEWSDDLCTKYKQTLKQLSLDKCKDFTKHIVSMIQDTDENLITGYPVYDREPLSGPLDSDSRITLLGDAAHPMSPFKGQGANQALLDAVCLGEEIARVESLISKKEIEIQDNAKLQISSTVPPNTKSSPKKQKLPRKKPKAPPITYSSLTQALRSYESNMIQRSTPKVLGSRSGVKELHCSEFINREYQLKRREFVELQDVEFAWINELEELYKEKE